jgi:hypothetical protein
MNFLKHLHCIDSLFQSSDVHQHKIDKKIFTKHNTRDNAWIRIDSKIYSIQNNDEYLLNIFQEYYGKNVKSFLLSLDKHIQINILNKLTVRFIGQIKD